MLNRIDFGFKKYLSRSLSNKRNDRLKEVPDFKTFISHLKVLHFYRSCLRTIKKVQNNNDKMYLKEWVRSDIESYRNITDLKRIDELLSQGNAQLRSLSKSLTLSAMVIKSLFTKLRNNEFNYINILKDNFIGIILY